MIGQLRGKLIEKQPPALMLDVQGVGYYLQAPLSTFFVLPSLGEEVTLRTHFIVREDAHLLFGFATQEERQLFQEIIKISGVGPKVALAILSGLSPQAFIQTIQAQVVERLQGIPGIGAKTAQRILVEMKDKLAKLTPLFSQTALSVAPTCAVEQAKQEAIAALVALGYKIAEATKAVNKAKNVTQGCESIIKEALQGLASA